jgi:hypothetical protein
MINKIGAVKRAVSKTRKPSFLDLSNDSRSPLNALAEYPLALTAAINSDSFILIGTIMCALSIAKLTVARTPGNLFRDFSIELTQDEQLIPVIDKSTCLV